MIICCESNCKIEPQELIWEKGVPPECKKCPNCGKIYRIYRCAKCGREFEIDEKYHTIKYLEGNRYHEGCKISLLSGNDYDVTYNQRISTNVVNDGVAEHWTGVVVQKVSRKDTNELVYKQTL